MNTDLTRFDELRAQIVNFVHPVSTMTVTDTATSAIAAGSLKTVKEFLREIESRRVEAVSPLNEQVKAVNAYAKEIASPLVAAETEIKSKMGAWANSERVRLESERREAEEVRRQAQRRADEERRAKEAELRAKVETERKAMAAKAASESAAAAMFGVDQKALDERVETERLKQEQSQKLEAEMLRLQSERDARAREVAAAKAAREAEAARPKNLRRVVKFHVTDASLIPRQYLVVDESLIRQELTRECDRGISIPGVAWHFDHQVVAR